MLCNAAMSRRIRPRQVATVALSSQELKAAWRPVTFTVDTLALISRRSFHDPFRIRWQVGLSSGDSGSSGSAPQDEHGVTPACREVDVPYVATCGSTARSPADGDLVSYATHLCQTTVYGNSPGMVGWLIKLLFRLQADGCRGA